MKSYQPKHIKSKNRQLVFDLFLEHQILSRAEINTLVDMSFPTVLKIVDNFLEKEIIYETGDTESNVDGLGRKRRLLTLNDNGYGAVGIVIERKFAHIGLINLRGDILRSYYIDLDNGISISSFKEIGRHIESLINDFAGTHILGIGIGCPTVINPETYKIPRLFHGSDYYEKSIQEGVRFLTESYDYPIFIENDVNLLALGESFLRGSQASSDLVCVYLGTGIGCGLILDRTLRSGPHFSAGEIGISPCDISYFDKKDISQNNNENIESVLGIEGIIKRFGVDLTEDGDTLTDTDKEKIINYISPYVAKQILDITNLLDINEYILSGIIADKLGDDLYREISRMLEQSTDIKIAVNRSYNEDCNVIGCAIYVFRQTLGLLLAD